MSGQPFIKMHGLGNDFVVLDLRARPLRLDAPHVRVIADRRTGVGCDQLICIEPSARADVFMRIFNADGSEVAACGNATRCVASLLFAEHGSERAVIETAAGLLLAEGSEAGRVTVDMGPARLRWDEIPLAQECDTLHVDLAIGPASAPVLSDPCCVNMGNPHAVFFVENVDAVDVLTVGPMLETHPLFPERANIGFAQVLSRGELRLKVWERGVGQTLACGSGACAAAVAAARRELTGRQVRIVLDGGALDLEWRREDGHVLMTGPVATSFHGALDESLLPDADVAAA
ncbi:MAG TPA: diaminopimelate epimerase [Alphaproteobacteria bacterium]|nr:diaminopimelate epimerase [Alphaproteobacteria bacterium]